MKRKGLLLILIIDLIVCAFVTLYSVNDIRLSRYQERVRSTNVVMSKIGNHMNSIFSEKWSHLDRVKKRIVSTENRSIDDLYNKLNEIYRESDTDYGFVDNNGEYYDRTGSTGVFMDFGQIDPGENGFVLLEPQLGASEEKKIVYITSFENPVVVEDVTVSYIVLIEQADSIQESFDISNYGENCLSCIIMKNGSFVYDNEANDSMNTSYNLLEYVKKNVTFVYDMTFDHLKSDIENEVDNTVLVEYHGTRYYFSYYHLALADWVSIMLVPEVNMDDNAGGFTERIVVDITYIFVTAMLLFSFCFLYMWNKTLDDQKRAVQAEKAANDAKTDFLSSMSHDIRTPMNAIVGMTEIGLLHNSDKEKMAESLEKINISSKHLLTLINDILDISKIESGKMTLNMASFSLVEAIQTLENIVRPQANEKNLSFKVNKDDLKYEFLYGDELRLNQVCINLLNNAVKYTESGGSVTLNVFEELVVNELYEGKEKVRLTCVVEDTGIGIDEEYQKIMYECFSRQTDSRVNKIGGSGLGLTICKQMVELMGGSLKCESKIGVGTTFTVIVDFEKAPESEAVSTSTLPSGEDEQLARKKFQMHVLVAEDNELNWEILESLLQIHGVTSERAENGQKCVDLVENSPEDKFDLILMDIRMPIMDGLEATKIIRKSKNNSVRNIPIVAMTADAFSEDIQECAKAGMNEHLAKPIDVKKLLAVLQRIKEKGENLNA